MIRRSCCRTSLILGAGSGIDLMSVREHHNGETSFN